MRMSLRRALAILVVVAAVAGGLFLLYRDADSSPFAGADTVTDDPGESSRQTADSLAGVAALADDWQRNAALYALLAGANRHRVEKLIAEAKALEPRVPHRYDIVRVLYIRYASLSPEAALDHLLAGDTKPSWIGAVFEVWAERDLDVAVARASMLGPLAKRIAARAILGLDMAPEQRSAVSKRLGMAATALGKHRRLPGESPAQAWDRATALQQGPERDALMMEAALSWAAEDPRAAWEALERDYMGLTIQARLESVMLRVGTKVLEAWLAIDPLGPGDWLREAAARRGIEARLYLPASSRVDYAVGFNLVHVLAQSDPYAAWEIAREMPMSLRGETFRELAEADAETALEMYHRMGRPDQAAFGLHLASVLMQHNPRLAVPWWAALGRRMQERTIGYLSIAHDQAPELVKRLFVEIDDPIAQHHAARQIVRWKRIDPESAWEWVSALGAVPPEESAFRTVLSAWQDREAATRAVSGLADQRLRDFLLAEIAERWREER